MRLPKSTYKTDVDRRYLLSLLLAGGTAAAVPGVGACEAGTADSENLANNLTWAVAWKQTAAEYAALCHQAYNLARMRLDLALAARKPGARPLAVITDMDDTILHADSYWGYLVKHDIDFFDDALWDAWVPKNLVTPVPGAVDFLDYCKAETVEVFYVTNRDQGERTSEYALGHLRHLELPYADEQHLYVFRDTSDKSPARAEIAASFDVALLLGDNLNDFRRDYYVDDVDERMALMERDRADWGTKFIVLPNPTSGHWIRAIFGASEPPPTDANRRRLKAAATRVAWDGR